MPLTEINISEPEMERKVAKVLPEEIPWATIGHSENLETLMFVFYLQRWRLPNGCQDGS